MDSKDIENKQWGDGLGMGKIRVGINKNFQATMDKQQGYTV